MCDLLPSVSSATCPGGAASPLFVLVGSAAALHSFEGLKAQSRSVRRARASSEETEMLVGKKTHQKNQHKNPKQGKLVTEPAGDWEWHRAAAGRAGGRELRSGRGSPRSRFLHLRALPPSAGCASSHARPEPINIPTPNFQEVLGTLQAYF